MARNILRMKYHPALKKVEFHAYQDGHEFDNYGMCSLYTNYENKPFVLQQQGNAFFDTIRTLFNGAGAVDLEVITTKTDYEDLEQMVEYYNRKLAHEKSNFRINATLKTVLPEMDKIYDKVREYGEEAIATLQQHCADFHTICSDNEKVQESIEFFSKDVQTEIDNIRDKIKQMDDNTVNLCFAGLYSAGKSTLINTILGYRILPEDIKPMTARSIYIRSPRDNEGIHIDFSVRNNPATLIWSEKSGTFSFSKSPAQNPIIKAINDKLEKHKTEPQHDQMHEVLKYLNGKKDAEDEEPVDVDPTIYVTFPIPLDRRNVRFKILDTPGTNSNTMLHRRILEKALEDQESSILIFVAPAIQAAEGEGNKDLLRLLQNEGKAIDIDRSLFVLNHADGTDSEARKNLKNSTIKAEDKRFKDAEDEKTKGIFEIDLTTKKLFFTSAKFAYIAKAVKAGIASEEQECDFESDCKKATNKFGHYYRDNHCATSECATEKMLKRCEAALKNAEGDQCQELYICSGVFALEDEIIRYGEKYSSAVRAHAIIDSVNMALVKMGGRADILSSKIYESLDDIDYEISKIESELGSAIKEQSWKFTIKKDEKMSVELMQELHISSISFSKEVIAPVMEYIDEILGRPGLFKRTVKFNEKQRDDIAKKVADGLRSFEEEYITYRQRKIENTQSDLIHNIRMLIQENGEISPTAKDFICKINPPSLKKPEVKPVQDIYNNLRESRSFFFFTREFLNIQDFKENLSEYFRRMQEDTQAEYRNEYVSTLNTILDLVQNSYKVNLGGFSMLLKALKDSRHSMEELIEKITETAEDLKICNQNLSRIIEGGVE